MTLFLTAIASITHTLLRLCGFTKSQLTYVVFC